MSPFYWILLLTISLSPEAFGRVRKVEVTQDQIVTVKTAIGIATIIQVPERPNSIVVGDQAGFKVEYLDQAITIKPLHGGARSNLYIYTDYRRYNVQLVTGPEPSADYVVYLLSPTEKPQKSSLVWTPLKSALKNESITLSIKRVGRTHDGVLLIEFKMEGATKEIMRPEWLWLTQGGGVRPIHNLFLSALEIAPGQTVEGVMQVLRSDIQVTAPLKIELRRKRTSSLTVPKVNLWK